MSLEAYLVGRGSFLGVVFTAIVAPPAMSIGMAVDHAIATGCVTAILMTFTHGYPLH
jgi:hypothetical protein